VVCGGCDGGSNTSVVAACETIGDQGIGELCKDQPDAIAAGLVECVRSWVIREVDRWLM